MSKEWKQQQKERICHPQQLPQRFELTADEQAFFETAERTQSINFCVTHYYASLASETPPGKDEPPDPIRKQFIPTRHEFTSTPYESSDPLAEASYSPVARMIHRYTDRVLVLVTGRCGVYCRYCFRRYFTGDRNRFLDKAEIEGIVDYLGEHTEVREVILSGGDPLMEDNEAIEELLLQIKKARADIRFRLATRMIVVLPDRITNDLVVMLRRYAPLWVVTQFNHPYELTSRSREAVATLVDMGIPVLNQTVLLRDINDSAETLQVLFQALADARVKPYYLFQADVASGTAHFRVPLERGFALMRELRSNLSGIAVPRYAVDLPGGGGKRELTEESVRSRGEGWYELAGRDGNSYYYPDEPPTRTADGSPSSHNRESPQ